MTEPNLIILYVDSPAISAQFYSALLGKPPVESSPVFAMFVLTTGVKLGLWARHTVEPAVAPDNHFGGGGELVFSVSHNDIVDALYADWRQRQLPVVQTPSVMDFGYTFVALDPDGHRLRVFAPSTT
ncbi:VOC family protein [Pantoea sp. B65]|uniref:VOC family protein n=1 Tax=Pantoea sp. B65 TaxID=2813359 RepID=UPI0039B426D3